jgi:hypothetical protein
VNERFARLCLRVSRLAGRALKVSRDQATALGELWRSSLQFRVTTSTLALSSAVVFVVIMALQYQITGSLLDTIDLTITGSGGRLLADWLSSPLARPAASPIACMPQDLHAGLSPQRICDCSRSAHE